MVSLVRKKVNMNIAQNKNKKIYQSNAIKPLKEPFKCKKNIEHIKNQNIYYKI